MSQPPQQRTKDSRILFGIVAASILGTALLLGLDQAGVGIFPESSHDGIGSDVRQIDGNQWIGCVERDHIEEIMAVIATQNLDAFQQAFTTRVGSGECFNFSTGDSVLLLETDPTARLIKVQPVGAGTQYWTSDQAIK